MKLGLFLLSMVLAALPVIAAATPADDKKAAPSNLASKEAGKITEETGTETLTYYEPTLQNIQRALLKTGALDLANKDVQDDYAQLNECEIFRKVYLNDFERQRLRQAVVKLVEKERASWPDAFYFTSTFKLAEYDFARQSFPLTADTLVNKVNAFPIAQFSAGDVCAMGEQLEKFPQSISVRVDQPLTITAIPLEKPKAEALLKRMLASGNGNRIVYARFKVVLDYLPPVVVENEAGLFATNNNYLAEGQLMSVEFFEDEAQTKPIWTFTRG